jgi:multimeric flavodoxin WrbA
LNYSLSGKVNMKILAINGSHRGRRGLTHTLLEEIRQGVEEAGGQWEEAVLADHTILQCLGCEVCHTEKSYLRCVLEEKDDVKAIQEKMAGADIIIFATPVYVFTMTGLLKKFLDRINATGDYLKLRLSKKGLLFHHINPVVCSKPFALVTVCGNIEKETSRNVVSYFRTYSRFMDAPQIGTLVRTAAMLLHNKTAQELPAKTAVLGGFRQAGRDLVLYGRIGRKARKQATRPVIPIPAIAGLLMKIKLLRPVILKHAAKAGAIQFS